MYVKLSAELINHAMSINSDIIIIVHFLSHHLWEHVVGFGLAPDLQREENSINQPAPYSYEFQ